MSLLTKATAQKYGWCVAALLAGAAFVVTSVFCPPIGIAACAYGGNILLGALGAAVATAGTSAGICRYYHYPAASIDVDANDAVAQRALDERNAKFLEKQRINTEIINDWFAQLQQLLLATKRSVETTNSDSVANNTRLLTGQHQILQALGAREDARLDENFIHLRENSAAFFQAKPQDRVDPTVLTSSPSVRFASS